MQWTVYRFTSLAMSNLMNKLLLVVNNLNAPVGPTVNYGKF